MNPTEGHPKFELENLVQKFTGQEPKTLSGKFAVFEEGRLYIEGTSIPALISQYFTHRSGLLLPKHAVIEVAPIDYAYRYIPLKEITNLPIPLETIIEIIRRFDQDDFLSVCSKFTDLSHPSEGTSELEDLIKHSMPNLHSRVSGLLQNNHKYFGPQATLVLMKLAILNESKEKNLPRIDLPTFILLCLAIQDFFSPERSNTTDSNLAMELPANYSIHRKLDPTYEYLQYRRRWEGEDEVSKGLRNAFQESCGYSPNTLADFVAGLSMQDRDLRKNFLLAESDEESAEIEKALRKISCSAEKIRQKISSPSTPNFIWDFSVFHEFPVIQRSDGGYVVVEKSLMVNRGLGWPLIYDSKADESLIHKVALKSEKQSKDIVIESLGNTWKDRIVDGPDIISIFGGVGIQSADLGIEFENGWVVLEISTFRTPFRALAAESRKLYKELIDQVAEEALQAVSTCEQLIAHSLNPVKEFRKIPSISKMYPIVVATEKFTTNPLTLCDIRKEVEDRKGGRNPRIAPVEVVNLEELETLLLMSKTYGLSIVNLLEKKAQGSFWSDSINNFLATFYRPQLVALSETKTKS